MTDNEVALTQWREEIEAMRKWADNAAQECATARKRLNRAKEMVRRLEERIASAHYGDRVPTAGEVNQ